MLSHLIPFWLSILIIVERYRRIEFIKISVV